jgi:tripartite-type tricarboxylate transporter receptor subunit TctC
MSISVHSRVSGNPVFGQAKFPRWVPAFAGTNGKLMVGLRGLVAMSVALAFSVNVATAQDYPVKPVHLVVPYAAGGGTDAVARYLARGLEQRLGQPFIVENRSGQGTAVGGAYVAKAPPDGYTLLMATSSTVAINVSIYKNLPYDPATDFAPISMIAVVPFVLIVHPSLGVESVEDLIKFAKAKPGALSYASGGGGTPHHIYMELFKTMAGIDLKHIPYRGGGPALTDVVAGHVPVMFADVAQAQELIRGGRVKALAVSVRKRVETLPNVPTMHEAGVVGYEANSWQCVVAPARLPQPIVAKLNKALVELMAKPETEAHFLGLGWVPQASTPAELGDHIGSEILRWAVVVKAAGASAE